MSIPTDPGASILDNNGEPILNQGPTGFAQRFDNVYQMFNAGIGQDNVKLGDDYAWTGDHTFSGGFSARIPGLAANARLSLSGGILSLVGENGSSPSSTNPVFFRRLSSAGNWENITFTSTSYCTIQDSASADSYFYNGAAGTPWGTTSGTLWGAIVLGLPVQYEMPLFIYVATASDGSNPCLFFSRYPHVTTTPSAAGIGYADNPPATPAETNFFAWTTNNVTSTHASQPCAFIGYVGATKTGIDDWTFYALTQANSGIQNYNFEQKQYLMPPSQNGAASGSFFSVDTGTAPTYGSQSVSYRFRRSNDIHLKGAFNNTVGNTAGAGTEPLILAPPLRINSLTNILVGNYSMVNGGSFTDGFTVPLSFKIGFGYSGNTVTGADQNNATRSLDINCIYGAT